MTISLPRLSLGLSGLLFLGTGAFFMYDPAQVARLLDLPVPPPALRVELSAVFGGLQAGLGLFFLGAAGHARWIRAALAAQTTVFGGMAGGRLIGMVATGQRSTLFLLLLLLELGGLLLGLVAFQRAKAMMQEYAARGLL